MTNGNVIGGGLLVLTGPSIVDSSNILDSANIERIVPYTQKNTR